MNIVEWNIFEENRRAFGCKATEEMRCSEGLLGGWLPGMSGEREFGGILRREGVWWATNMGGCQVNRLIIRWTPAGENSGGEVFKHLEVGMWATNMGGCRVNRQILGIN